MGVRRKMSEFWKELVHVIRIEPSALACAEALGAGAGCSFWLSLWRAVAPLIVGTVLPSVADAALAPAYRLQVLDTLGGAYSVGVAVNASGQVAGYAASRTGYDHAARWDGRHPVDLHSGTGETSQATAINDVGQVVGWSHDTPVSGRTSAVRWDGATATVLPSLGGPHSWANGINNAGDVVGESRLPGDEVTRATLWLGSDPFDLGSLGGRYSRATAINDVGQVVGDSSLPGDRVAHATLWSDGRVIDLGALYGRRTSSTASAINDRGHVVGLSEAPLGPAHAFVWRGGGMVDLGPGRARDINEHDLIVGVGPGEGSAWIWHGRSGVDLNTLLEPAAVAAGWHVHDASGINDQGWVSGWAVNDTLGQSRAVLLTPVPEPEPSALLVAGLIALSWAVRRSDRRGSSLWQAARAHLKLFGFGIRNRVRHDGLLANDTRKAPRWIGASRFGPVLRAIRSTEGRGMFTGNNKPVVNFGSSGSGRWRR